MVLGMAERIGKSVKRKHGSWHEIYDSNNDASGEFKAIASVNRREFCIGDAKYSAPLFHNGRAMGGGEPVFARLYWVD